jgi:rod shape-determining protein MreC
MYRKQVRRRRATLVLLVVACLVLISTHFSESEDGPLHLAQNGVGSVLAPLEDGASRALKPFRDLVNWFDETFEARGENDQLRSQVADLQEELTETREELERGIEAKKVIELGSAPALAGFQRIEADVIARSPSQWDETLMIDVGSSDGVSPDDAVITGDGLVGLVADVNGGSSRVILVTNADSAVTARVLDNGAFGLVEPSLGNQSSLLFGYIDSDKELKNGDELVTAGFSEGGLNSRFPPDIPIGEIDEDDAEALEQAQEVRVEPAADLSELDDLTVLVGGGG